MVARTNEDDFGSPAAEPQVEQPAALRPLGRRSLVGDDDSIESPLWRLVELGNGFSERIRERPLTFLALALGAGFAIGGALSFRGGRLAISAASRHLGRELLRQVL